MVNESFFRGKILPVILTYHQTVSFIIRPMLRAVISLEKYVSSEAKKKPFNRKVSLIAYDLTSSPKQ